MAATGKFVLESNENYEAWLATVGVPAELAAKMAAAKPTLEVNRGDTSVTIKTIAGDKSFTNTITYGQDSTVELAGFQYSVNVERTDSGYKGSLKAGSKTGTVVVDKTDAGYVQTMTVDGVTTKKNYKKA